jgi:hypothetical protein
MPDKQAIGMVDTKRTLVSSGQQLVFLVTEVCLCVRVAAVIWLLRRRQDWNVCAQMRPVAAPELAADIRHVEFWSVELSRTVGYIHVIRHSILTSTFHRARTADGRLVQSGHDGRQCLDRLDTLTTFNREHEDD